MLPAKQQLYFEDVAVGMEIPPLEKRPNFAQLFMYSAVVRNIHRIHYDQDYARTEQLPGVVVQGTLQGAFLCQLLVDWLGDRGWLKKISYSNRGAALPGDVLICRGKVTRMWQENGQNLVECEIWEENQRGEVLAPGSAVAILPSRQD